jgi:two-component system, sensor histidine kinase and response regulator
VLVVEDNIVNQKVTVGMLDRFGLRADVAGNGVEAVEMVNAFPYELIFMDCQMPEMDGYAATQQIRRQKDSMSHVVIIAMTAEVLADVRDQCLKAGMDDYIAKPVDPAELSKKLQRWFPAKAPRRSPERPVFK